MVFKLVISKLVQTSMYYYVHWHTNKRKLNKKRKKTGPRIDGEAMKLRAEKRQVAVNKAGRFSCFYFGENFDTKNTTEKPT